MADQPVHSVELRPGVRVRCWPIGISARFVTVDVRFRDSWYELFEGPLRPHQHEAMKDGMIWVGRKAAATLIKEDPDLLGLQSIGLTRSTKHGEEKTQSSGEVLASEDRDKAG